jgi:uncharacterized membrane protein SpoIIM required for sporulation
MQAEGNQTLKRSDDRGTKRVQRLYVDRQPLWQKLENILGRIDKRGHAGLSRQELQELGGLYRCVAADLARVRSQSGQNGHELQIYLNNLAVRAHNQIYQDDGGSWRKIFHFFWYGFPALVRKHIIYILAAFLFFLVPLLLSYQYIQTNPNFGDLEALPGHPLLSEDMRSTIESHHLWNSDKEHVSPIISSCIITNNIRVTLAAFALGVTYAIGTVYILIVNGLMIGTVFGACHMHGMAPQLLTFTFGHGFLELTSIFICGGGGLLMGTALLFPGRLRRVDALKMVSRDAFCLLAGCIPLLLIAGLIEGFISTQDTISSGLKFSVGILSLIALILYLLNGLGRQPSR